MTFSKGAAIFFNKTLFSRNFLFFFNSAAKPKKSTVQVDEGNVSMLVEMAFTREQATKALKMTDNNMERAVEWIFSHPNDLGTDPEEDDEPEAGGAAGGSRAGIFCPIEEAKNEATQGRPLFGSLACQEINPLSMTAAVDGPDI